MLSSFRVSVKDKGKKELIFLCLNHGLFRHPTRSTPPHPPSRHRRFPSPTNHCIRTLPWLPNPNNKHPHLPRRSLRRPSHRPLRPTNRKSTTIQLVPHRTHPLLSLQTMGLLLARRRYRRNSTSGVILQESTTRREDCAVRALDRKSADNALSPLPPRPPRNQWRNLPG